MCRAGWFLIPDGASPSARIEDNRRAVDEAAALGARALAVVCGPASGYDLPAARRAVTESIEELAGYAAEQEVTLAIEPMHPVYCGDRSVIVTLDQSLGVLDTVGRDGVRLVLDSYHLWWDPELARHVARASGRIFAVQLADWLAPPPHPLNGRGMLGEGTIDLRAFCRLVDSTGFGGWFSWPISGAIKPTSGWWEGWRAGGRCYTWPDVSGSPTRRASSQTATWR